MRDGRTLVETLLQERDEMYLELSRLQKIDQGALEEAEQKIDRYETIIIKKDETIKKITDEKDEIIRKLTDQLAWLRRKFWKPTSEKFIAQDPNQRKIDWDGLDTLPEEQGKAEEVSKEIITYERKKPKKEGKPVRVALPEDLRREVEVIEPEGIDENWTRIGQEITETLELKPGELFVRQIVRPKYVLNKQLQEDQGIAGIALAQENIKIAKLPMLPIPRSNAGASLLAHLLVNKYLYHLPFHRIIEMLKHSGVRLPASTVNGWFMASSDLLRALYRRLVEIVLATDYIQVDESTVPVINNEKHRAVKAYLWAVRSVMENLVFFHYDKGSRAQKVVVELLKNYKGAIQTDGYEAYSIYENKKGVLLLGCWTHARRKFTEALKEDKAKAGYALEQIGLIYTVEAMADDKQLDFDQRAAERARLAYPIMVAFEKWIYKEFGNAMPNGRMYRALSYTYKIYQRLTRYHLDGRYKPDNNLVENAIRPLALGRKNFLFCGNHDAAENTAVMYSLMACCKAAGVDPHTWLTDVLTRIPYYNADYSKDLAELLPHNWKVSKDS